MLLASSIIYRLYSILQVLYFQTIIIILTTQLCLLFQASSIEEILTKVKSQLYAKFGNNINLEAPES